jgi:hypothetical protein
MIIRIDTKKILGYIVAILGAIYIANHVHPLLLAVMASFGWGMVAMISCLTLFKK